MWLLKDSNGKIHYLKTNKTYTVGRKQADIVLENDLSISRCHSELEVSLKEDVDRDKCLTITSCIVKDSKSKYGTYIIRNGVQIKVTDQGLDLQPKDSVKFGLQNYVFKVENIPFMTFTSKIDADHKKKLKEIMDRIGGIIVDDFNHDCTHLTATIATPTNKVLSALIAGLPIVGIKYWVSLEKAIDSNKELPDPKIFTLPMQDKGINSQKVCLLPNPQRKILFQDKTFIFFCEKTYKLYKNIVKNAGGKAILHPTESQSNMENFSIDTNIFIQAEIDSMKENVLDFYTSIYDKLKEKKMRMVVETEIPLAVLYVSIKQYCNPKYQFKKLMQRKPVVEDTSKVLALDTQDLLPPPSHKIVKNIEESCIAETNDELPSCSFKNSESMSLNENMQRNTQLFNQKFGELKSNQPQSNNSEVIKNVFFNVNNKTNKSIGPLDNAWKSIKHFKPENSNNEKSLFHNSKKRKNKYDSDDEEEDPDETVFKKKQKKTLEILETKRNDQNKVMHRLEKIIDIESEDEISVPQKQKESVNPKLEPNLTQFGFKKLKKEIIDFDLDELDDIKPIKINVMPPERTNFREEPHYTMKNHTNKISNIDESPMENYKPLDKQFSKEDKKSWTLPKLSDANKIMKCKSEKTLTLRDFNKLDPDSMIKKNFKVFKKNKCIIPSERISLLKKY